MHDLLHTWAHHQNSQNPLPSPTSRSHHLGWRIQAPDVRSLITVSDSALNNARLLSVRKCLIKTWVTALTRTTTENNSLHGPFTSKSSYSSTGAVWQPDSAVALHRNNSVTQPWHERNSETRRVVCAPKVHCTSPKCLTGIAQSICWAFLLLKPLRQAGKLAELEEAARSQWDRFAY